MTTDKIAGRTKQVVAGVTGDGQLAGEGKQQVRNSKPAKWRAAHLTRYFFHLEGDLPAHDVLGHECSSDVEARAHAGRLAHGIAAQKPEMVRDNNGILVVDEYGRDVARVSLASLSA